MNGPQDMGGRHGFGSVAPDPHEPMFHADWEKRALALVVAMGATGTWNIDQSRNARESLPPVNYISFPYYRIWTEALINMIVSFGLAKEDEIETGHCTGPGTTLKRIVQPNEIDAILAQGAPANRDEKGPPKFEVGDAITTIVQSPYSHTRLPGYAMGRPGKITGIRGFHVFPDRASQGVDEAQWLYGVTFEATDLWGKDTTASTVTLDLWEPYLERQ